MEFNKQTLKKMEDQLNKPPSLQNIIEILEKELPSLKKRYYIQYFGIFGSYIKGEEKQGSDLDILVSFNETPTLFQFIRLEKYLSDILNLKVDLVMKDALRPEISKHILSEVVEI